MGPAATKNAITAAAPVFRYRGAEIRCAKGGHVCSLFMEGHPLHGLNFGSVGAVTPLVNLWVNIRGLPEHMRLAIKPRSSLRPRS